MADDTNTVQAAEESPAKARPTGPDASVPVRAGGREPPRAGPR